jgi:hypothetical protein
MAIAFERINLFNKSQGVIGESAIEDLFDDKGLPCGTRIWFTVPIVKV